MISKQLFFFATKEDLEPIISLFESKVSLKYVEIGLFDYSKPEIINSLLEITNLGIVSSGDWNHCRNYLCTLKHENFEVRKVPQKNGTIKYAVDQNLNHKTITIKPGGKFEDGCLIAGSTGTISEDPISLELFKLLTKEFKTKFRKIGNFYVGEHAEGLLNAKWRLVTNSKSPIEYDLRKN